MRPIPRALCLLVLASGCKNVESFSNGADHYEGEIVQGSFVRAGFEPTTRACLVLDAEHLADAPGTFSTSDGRFRISPLRPIPQFFHDPLSTMSFGQGRVKNLMYGANGAVAGTEDTQVIVSLMQSNEVEMRIVRGAPGQTPTSTGVGTPLFGVFQLKRARGACSF